MEACSACGFLLSQEWLGQADDEIAQHIRKHAEPTLRIRHATDFAGYIAKVLTT